MLGGFSASFRIRSVELEGKGVREKSPGDFKSKEIQKEAFTRTAKNAPERAQVPKKKPSNFTSAKFKVQCIYFSIFVGDFPSSLQTSWCWIEKACPCICSPLGRSLWSGLKSSKHSPLTSWKLGSFVCTSPLCFNHCSRPSNSFSSSSATLSPYRAPGVSPAVQLHGKSRRSVSVTPTSRSALTPGLALAPHASRRHSSSPLPPLEREATADRMLRWREPAANGGNRREGEGRRGEGGESS